MQVYLLKDLPGKGKAGEIIDVNDGYGKNYIIKNKIGKPVDNSILSQVKAKKVSEDFHKTEEVKEINSVCRKLEKTRIVLKANVGANGKMFGSITSAEIAAELARQSFFIDKKNIILNEPIKSVGTYTIKVKFNHGIECKINLIVEAN